MYLTDCHKSSIYTLDNRYLCDAAVSRITEDTACLTFNAPAADILRSEVLVTFYDNFEGLVSFECSLSDYKEYLDAPGVWHSQVTCTFGNSISVVQRRKDLKVHVQLQTSVTYADHESKERETIATIHNISAGGVYLSCKTIFFPGQQLDFIFKTNSRTLKLSAEVLRVEPPAEIDTPYGYGCRFVHLQASAEAALRNYVYRQELLIRRH